MYSRLGGLLCVGLSNAKAARDDLRQSCATVLTNAMKSLSGAFALLRTGWRLQPYLCLRSGMEAASVVIHLLQHPGDLKKLKSGRLDSPNTIKSAKTALPPIGRLYGLLSEEFVHVGKPFLYVQKGNVFEKSEWEMWQALANIANFGLMLYVITELLFYDLVSEHHCWARRGEAGYEQRWSDEMAEWRRAFVEIYKPHYRGDPVVG